MLCNRSQRLGRGERGDLRFIIVTGVFPPTLVIRIIQTNSTYRCYASLASVSGGSVFEQVVRETGGGRDSNCHRICLPADSGERIVEWKTQQVGLKEV